MRDFERIEELNIAWRAGLVDDATYTASYARLNASHGLPCTTAGCNNPASYKPPEGGGALCGDCALKLIEGRQIMGPKRYKKKPVEILTIQYDGENIDALLSWGAPVRMEGGELLITTLEDGKGGQARHVADPGDFIIRGVAGEFYACKPAIFAATYDAVEE